MPRPSRASCKNNGQDHRALLLHNLAGEILEANQAACEAFGYARAALRRLKISDLEPDFSPIDLAGFLARDQEHDCVIRPGTFRHKQGSLLPAEVCHLKIEVDRNLLCLSVVEIKKDAAGAFTTNDDSTSARAIAPAVIVNRGRAIRFANRACLALFAYEDELEDRRKPSWLAKLSQHWRQISAQRTKGTTTGFKGIALRKDGNAFPFEAESINVRLRDGRAVVTCITDMSKFQEADIEAQQFALLAEANPNPTLELTADGQLLCVNPAARRMTESAGQINTLNILPLDWKTIVEDCLATSRSEHRYETTREGRTIAWSFIPAPERSAVRCFARFVTEQKLFLYEQSEHGTARRSLAQWAEGIAHELNNILTLIQSHASYLLSEKQLDEESTDSTRQIYSAVDRAASLTEKLLMIGRRD